MKLYKSSSLADIKQASTA